MLEDKLQEPTRIRHVLLSWYDSYRRDLPWRSPPGIFANPYHVWLSEIMLQQTTVAAVKSYFGRFVNLWPTVHDLSKASQDDVLREWAGLGYYARGRNLHKAAQILTDEYDGIMPDDLTTLKSLPGIGDYTAAAIRSIAFDKPATVIDGNVERVISRLYTVDTPLPRGKSEIRAISDVLFQGECQTRPSCFAQSLMDLGATVCTPKKPLCMSCPVAVFCQAYASGQQEVYPRKERKKSLPKKHAIAYLYVDDGCVYIEKRPDKGMLGGMVGFPTSDWIDVGTDLPETVCKNRSIKHVFTHFSLVLYPIVVREGKGDGMVPLKDIENIGLPTLFKKLWHIVKDQVE